MRDVYKVHASYGKECGVNRFWGHLAHLKAFFAMHIHSAFTRAQEQIIFCRSILCLQGESLCTVFFLSFQDTQEVADRWDSSDLQILQALESLFSLKTYIPSTGFAVLMLMLSMQPYQQILGSISGQLKYSQFF